MSRARNAVTLTADLARASGQDAANVQMRKANRARWSIEDWNLAAVKTARLMLHVPFEHGGLGGSELAPKMLDDLGLTEVDTSRAGDTVGGAP